MSDQIILGLDFLDQAGDLREIRALEIFDPNTDELKGIMYVKELSVAQVNHINKKVQSHIKNGRMDHQGMKIMRNELITLGWTDANGSRIIDDETDKNKLSRLPFSIANRLNDVISEMSGMQREADEEETEQDAENLD
jgi:hypothetical protein